VPLGTVKSRLSVGVRRLRQVLSQQREGACR
jgi:DNA-directed RNA polymerase specialized sigma24 family protein